MNNGGDTSSSVLTGQQIQRALKRNIIAGMFGITFWWTISPNVTQLFALRLGAGDFEIAVLSAIVLLTFPAQILSSYLAEKYNSRKPLWLITAFIARSLWIPVIIMPAVFRDYSAHFKIIYLMIFYFIYNFVINLTVAPWFSWISDLVPKERSGHFWGHRYGYLSLSSVIILILIGLFLDWKLFPKDSLNPFIYIISFGIFAGYIDVYLHRKIPEPQMDKGEGIKSLGKLLTEPWSDRHFRSFVFALTYYTVVLSLYRSFFVVFMKKYLLMNNLQIMLLSVVSLVGSLMVSRTWGFLSDHFGVKSVLVLLFLGHALLPLVFFFMFDTIEPHVRFVILCIACFIDYCFMAGTLVVNHSFFGSSLPRRNRSMYVALFYSILGLCSAAAPPIGNSIMRLFDHVHLSINGAPLTSYHLLFGLGFFLTITTAYFAARMPGEWLKPPHHIIAESLSGRVFTISRRLYILAQSDNEEERLESLDVIERTGSPLAIKGLKKHLEDPNERIRTKTKKIIDTFQNGEGV